MNTSCPEHAPPRGLKRAVRRLAASLPKPGAVGGRGGPRRLSAVWARRQRAFTLAEVLAALAFMAIVIPVAIEGLRIASLAGQVGLRKAVAARIAERVLNEAVVTRQWQSGTLNGVIEEGTQEYHWSLLTERWSQDAMRLVTVQVSFPAQGREYDVRLSTLVSEATP